MIEPRDGARLAQNAIADGARRRRRETLERDAALQTRVVAEKDLAHSPRAERGDDFVRAEAIAG
jgi:hypothetical protein